MSIIDTFMDGMGDLFKNPILFVPWAIYFLISLMFYFVIEVARLTVFASADFSELLLYYFIMQSAFTVVFLILACYVAAGAVGMSKEAIVAGKTKFSDMTKYGKKFTLRLILASIVLLIFYLVTVIFWAPAVYVFMNLGVTFEDLSSSNISAMVTPILLGALLTFIYSLILTFLFYFVVYAIVVDDMPVIKAYKKSCSLLKQNFLKVFVFIVLILVSAVLYYIFSLLVMIPFSFFALIVMFAFNPWALLLYNFVIFAVLSI